MMRDESRTRLRLAGINYESIEGTEFNFDERYQDSRAGKRMPTMSIGPLWR